MKQTRKDNSVRKTEFENMLGEYEVTHLEGDDVMVRKQENEGMITKCRKEIIMRQVTLVLSVTIPHYLVLILT